MAGIVGYGVHIPRMRIRADDFRKAWGSFSAPGVTEKAVPDVDDDSLTMAVNAARSALASPSIDPARINIVALASSALPYETRFQVGTLVKALGLPETCVGLQFAGSSKAGSEALISTLSLLNDKGGHGLVAAGDCRRSSIYNPLEHCFGAAGCAVVLGTQDLIAEVAASTHFMDDIPGERFRPAGTDEMRDIEVKEYTEHYATRVIEGAARRLLDVTGMRPGDFRFFAVTQIDGRSAPTVARRLGLREDSTAFTNLAARLGDTGAAGALLALAAALDCGKPGDWILLTSYGEGGGADALAIRVAAEVAEPRRSGLEASLGGGEYIDFIRYLKVRNRLR